MKKLIPFALLVIALLFVFYNEGAFEKVLGSNVPEDQLISDISANNSDIERAGLTINDIDILSSEQNKDLGIYTCTVKYTAENTDVSYTGNMTLTYMKHDGSWMFSNYENGDTFYEPKSSCDESVAKAYIQNEYEEQGVTNAQLDFTLSTDVDQYIIPNAVDSTGNWHAFYYIVSGKENSVCSWSDSWSVSCCFDLCDGWQAVDSTKERLSEAWDLCGTWSLTNDIVNVVVDVTAFDIDIENNSVTVTYSWQLTVYNGSTYAEGGVKYSSDTPVTVTEEFDSDQQYINVNGNLANVYFCGRPVSWDIKGDNEENVGIWVKVYDVDYFSNECSWLTRQ